MWLFHLIWGEPRQDLIPPSLGVPVCEGGSVTLSSLSCLRRLMGCVILELGRALGPLQQADHSH